MIISCIRYRARTLVSLAIVGLVSGALGCTTRSSVATRSTGPWVTAKPWIEVRSEHFTLTSSLDEIDTVALARELEFFRAVMLALTNLKGADSSIPTRVYAFESLRGFNHTAAARAAGYLSADLRGYYVALHGIPGKGISRTLKHEYAHFLLRDRTSLVYPAWFAEGFAQFVAAIEVKDGYAKVGIVPGDKVRQLAKPYWLPMARILGYARTDRWSRADVRRLYAQSWLFVHYLMRDAAGRLSFADVIETYLKQVEAGASVAEASEVAFGESPRKLGKLLKNYLRRGQFEFFGIKESALDWSPEVTVRLIDEASVAERLGELALQGGRIDVAKRFFARALELDPELARAHAGMGDVIKARARWEEARAHFERAVELDPEDPLNQLDIGEYWHARARKTEDLDARHEMLVKARRHYVEANKLDDSRPEAYSVYGASYLFDGEDAAEGVETLEYAEHLLPSNLQIRLWLAEAYVKVGRNEEARTRLATIIAWSHGSPTAEKARALLEELDAGAREREEVRTD